MSEVRHDLAASGAAPPTRPGTAWGGVRHALFNGNGLAKRLLIAVVLFSSLITAVITAVELYGEYRRDLREIDRAFGFIDTSYAPSLAHSVWQLDDEAIQTQLKGLLHLPDIEHAAIEVDGQALWSAGQIASRYQRHSAVALRYESGERVQTIGTLTVTASVDGAVARVWSRLFSALVGNAIKTALVALFMLLVFQLLVTQHLAKVARYVRDIDVLHGDPSPPPLKLDRSDRTRWRPDVLDTVVAAINAYIDVRREAEAAVRASQARLLALTAHSSVLIYEVDGEGRTTFASRGDDPPRRAVVGSMARDWFPPDQRQRFDEGLRKAFAAGSRETFEVSVPGTSGAPRPYVITVAPIAVGEGVSRAAVTALDVTDLKRAEEALLDANRQLETRVRERTTALEAARDAAERANRGKSEFLSRMSHELRTPMNAILGFAQLLEAKEPQPTQRRWLGEIRHAGDHLLALIDELLDLARIEVGKLSVRLEPVGVKRVVHEAATMCRMAADGRKVELHIAASGPSAAMAVMADPTRLRQVLVNLLSNAIKYNRDGGRVTVRCEPVDDARRIRITVDDTGVGIAREQLGQLFMPFERLGYEQSAIQGSGIGLALSKRLAELMHGRIGAESVLGQGSSFWIELPATALDVEPRPPPLRADAPTPARPKLRVLYIEDHPINIALMQAAFEDRADLELLTAETGAAGVALARAELPDVILLDLLLAPTDGFAVLQELRRDARLAGTPVVAVTASAMTHDIDRGRAAGFAAYVTKPFRVDELLALIDRFGPRR